MTLSQLGILKSILKPRDEVLFRYLSPMHSLQNLLATHKSVDNHQDGTKMIALFYWNLKHLNVNQEQKQW